MVGPISAKARQLAGVTAGELVHRVERRASTVHTGAASSLGRTIAQAVGQISTSDTVSALSTMFCVAAIRATAGMRIARMVRKICTRPGGMTQ